jgi:hypothetical protein
MNRNTAIVLLFFQAAYAILYAMVNGPSRLLGFLMYWYPEKILVYSLIVINSMIIFFAWVYDLGGD